MRQPGHAFEQVPLQLLTKARADQLARFDLVGILHHPLALAAVVGCIYSSTATWGGIVASNVARHSGLDRAYFAEPAADQSGRRHPAV